MNKKLLTIIIAAALVASLAVGGTLAYLTDRDAEVNIFTVGNVEIEVEENFSQGAELMPGITITKEVSIKNTGDNNAWIWYSYAVPVLNADTGDLIEIDMVNTDKWVALGTPYQMEIEGQMYNVYTYGWPEYVAPDASTGNGMVSVHLNKWVDYNVNDGKWYHVYNGVVTPIAIDVDNARVYVTGYAIQEIGMADIHAAYANFNEQWGNPQFDPAAPMNPAPVTYEVVLSADTDADYFTLENIEADTVAITVKPESATDYVIGDDVVVVAENGMLLVSEKDLGVFMIDCTVNAGGGIEIDAANGTVLIGRCSFTVGEGELVTLTGAGQVLIGSEVYVNGTLITNANVNQYINCAGHVRCYGADVDETIEQFISGNVQ